MDTVAVVMQEPGCVELNRLGLEASSSEDLVVDVAYSGISTGTERLLWQGKMPPFPGMGYPLVPGYETVGVVREAPEALQHRVGEFVFVSGARCYGDVRGLFGGAASRLITPPEKAFAIPGEWGEQGVLIALAATAHHAAFSGNAIPEVVVGHGVLGRLIARVIVAAGAPAPVVWETNATRRAGDTDYLVMDPADDSRTDYRTICDASGDQSAINSLIARLAHRGELVLAGFYAGDVAFNFPMAFMTEARLTVAAEWAEEDLIAVTDMVRDGRLSLDGLITHRLSATDADDAYRIAFDDADCLKMILDWRDTE
ncbi:MAG: chlorophyll synthesis pathway protein BchC [Pseudomonadota bacterium]